MTTWESVCICFLAVFHSAWIWGRFVCVPKPTCSHITPTVDCALTVYAQIPIVYLIEQASYRPDVRFEVVSIFMHPLRWHVVRSTHWNTERGGGGEKRTKGEERERQKNGTKRQGALTCCIAKWCCTWFININETAHTVQVVRNVGVASLWCIQRFTIF